MHLTRTRSTPGRMISRFRTDPGRAGLSPHLTHALGAIFSAPFLYERLCLKGGTALNKLFFPAINRLSVDLDFNAVAPKALVLAERGQVASQVMPLLTAQDAGYELTHDYRRYEQSTIHAFVLGSGAPSA